MDQDIVVTTLLGAACAAGYLRLLQVLLRAGAPLDSACSAVFYYPS